MVRQTSAVCGDARHPTARELGRRSRDACHRSAEGRAPFSASVYEAPAAPRSWDWHRSWKKQGYRPPPSIAKCLHGWRRRPRLPRVGQPFATSSCHSPSLASPPMACAATSKARTRWRSAPSCRGVIEALTNPLSDDDFEGATFERSTARLLEPDTEENLHEFFIRNRWTDFLPIVRPTEERVERVLRGRGSGGTGGFCRPAAADPLGQPRS